MPSLVSQPIKAFIFDCYDVLYIAAGPEYFDGLLAAYPQYAEQLRDLGKQADYGFISLDDMARAIAGLIDDSPAAVKHGLSGGHAQNRPLLELIRRLRSHYKTALLSNMSADSLGGIFTPAQLNQLFDEVIVSSQIGLIKPSSELFLLAAGRLGVDTSECLFIDDQPDNCDGARAMGMRAEVYRGMPALGPVLASYGIEPLL